MKILFLAHRTPYPPDKGDKIRSFHMLSQLGRRHAVSLVYWLDDPRDGNHASALREICGGSVTPVPLSPRRAKLRAIYSLAKGSSFSTGYYGAARFKNIVDARMNDERPDLIYVFSSAMAQYAASFQSVPRIVDFVDVDSEKWRRLAQYAPFPIASVYRVEHKRLARFEIDVSRWAQCSLFVSETEAKLFAEIGGQGEIATIPNGVSSESAQRPIYEESNLSRKRTFRTPEESICILFVGTMSYFPNADAVVYFAAEILPRIRRTFPKVVFDIVGRDPSRAVRKLSALDGVRVHGEVADLQPYLARADVSVAPMRIAQGVPNKVLEAMAAGLPVVATGEAVKGICAKGEEDLLIGDTPDGFAEQVVRVISDRELRMRLTKRARQKLQEKYNWRTIGDQVADLIERAAPNATFATHKCLEQAG